ncbi:hypothetical protein [Janibacter terrae]|uniref:hypothetical protein n=1 Tax=Janibacter terrae TaxID=103817 RepID=UPI00082A1C73|nr:hypothetical protein [Janibacter terrae]
MHPFITPPSADIFEAGQDFFSNIESLGLSAVGAIIIVVLIKQVFKAPTVMASIAGIVTAIFVGWLVQQYQNDDIGQVFDDTVSETVGAPVVVGDAPGSA